MIQNRTVCIIVIAFASTIILYQTIIFIVALLGYWNTNQGQNTLSQIDTEIPPPPIHYILDFDYENFADYNLSFNSTNATVFYNVTVSYDDIQFPNATF